MRMAVFFFAFSLFASGLNIAEAVLPSTPITSGSFIEHSPIYPKEIESNLNEAISSRLGLPYRWAGTDDNGYDCSGFVWRVFREAGVDFNRDSARNLWQKLPEATRKSLAFRHAGILPRIGTRRHRARRGFVLPRLDLGASCCLISINPINIGEAG